MVSSTRSGRILNSKDTRSLRSSNTGVKVKSSNTSGSNNSGSIKSGTSRSRIINRNSKDTKRLIASDSAPADSCSLRSPGEPPIKKMTKSSTIVRKSARLNNQTPVISSDKSNPGRVENKRPASPLRRSERIEKYEASSSPGSRKSSKSSSSVDTGKRENGSTGEKTPPAGTKGRSSDAKLGIKSSAVSKKKKRLDARSYRAYMNLQKKKAKSSDSGGILKEDNASHRSTIKAGNKYSGESREGGDQQTRSRGHQLSGNCSAEDGNEAMEGSISSSRELADLILRDETHRESTCCNGEKRCSVDDTNESKCEDSCLLSKCSDNLLESSPVATIANETDEVNVEQEDVAVGDRTEACCLAQEEPGTPELMDSNSEGGLPADVVDAGSGGEVGGPKKVETATDIDSDISVTALNDKFSIQEVSVGEATSSSQSERSNKNIEACATCYKLQRVHNDAQGNKLCSSSAVMECDMSISPSEVVCEQIAKLRSPCKEGSAMRCSHEGKAQEKENILPSARGQLVRSERQSADCLVASPGTIPVLMEEDARKFEATSGIGITEEHCNFVRMEESSQAIQAVIGPNACVICKHPGLLLCCDGKGCRRSYHFSCLDPPLLDVPPGVWLCLSCVKKKLEMGLYSVSEGMESVWSIKEGMQTGKEYLVKYKGLAHVHNRWIPESQMLTEAPMLLAKFTKKYQKEKAVRWKQEWTEPQRLLQKRLLMPRKLADDFFSQHSNSSSCYTEWLVKWKSLGYEHASWELENSPFLLSSEAMMLIKDYENRHDEAKRASDPSRSDEALQVKNSPFQKLSKLPDGLPPGLDNDHLNCINRIREYWHKSQNALLIDDQERITKSILFVLALQSCTCRPFLVISTINSLSLWEAEFIHLAPSINVVTYSGKKDIRKMIRTLEFYEAGGSVMFQVLLSHPEAIIEDLDALDCIGWESIIVDDCQNPRISKNLELFNNLSCDFRLLLSGQLKDSLVEYVNLLSFLDSIGKENCVNSLKSDSNDSVGTLPIIKERLTRHIAYERKSDSSKFLEYWVPVWLSNVQLEQYCATLISNSIALRSSSKIDHVGALRNIVISTRKCCDHPFLVDQSLQGALTKGLPAVEYLNIGVGASGKLQLLDKILQEIRKQGLRVLILFQSIGGTGRNKIGDFLDDFLHQRFGIDSYERVDSGLIMSKKVAALNKFNDKAMGRFVFLIENRACLPSIKLSSVDAVIIYDSDWNPLNDLKALQRISIESQFDRVKVFRLYTSFTVEEKVLIFAKQDMILESNIQSISPNMSHSLLSWGASYLFSKLDEFHKNDNPTMGLETSGVNSLMSDVAQELLMQLQKNDMAMNSNGCSILIKALQSGTSYSRNILLVGEKEGIASLDADPPSFWSNLLEGRYPQWRYISGLSQRTRRKLPYFDESSNIPEVESDEVKKKRRRVCKDTVDPLSLQSWLHDKRKEFGGDKEGTTSENSAPSSTFNRPSLISPRKTPYLPSSISKEPEAPGILASSGSQVLPNSSGAMIDIRSSSPMLHNVSRIHNTHAVESEGREKLRNAQRNLHLLLKPELLKLCEILSLPEDVKCMTEKFLEYIMNNHHVNREPEAILQAFKISLCWRAATFLRHKVDHQETLALAKNCLNFECSEEQAESVYSKLRILKKKFPRQTGAVKDDVEPHSLEKPCMHNKEKITGSFMHERILQPVASDHQELEEGELRDSADNQVFSEQVNLERERTPLLEIPVKPYQNVDTSMDGDRNNRIDLINKVYSDRVQSLLLKQQLECTEFNRKKEEEKEKLQKSYDQALEIIWTLELDSATRDNKIKLLNQEFSKKRDGFEEHMKCQRRRLVKMQVEARNKERQVKDRWLSEAKAGILEESFDVIPLPDSGFRLEEFKVTEEVGAPRCSRDAMLLFESSDHQRIDLATACPVDESREPSAGVSEIVPNGGEGDIPMEINYPTSDLNSMDLVQPVKPNSNHVPEAVPQVVPENVMMGTDSPASRSTAVNAVVNIPEGIADPGTEDTVDIEHHSHADNSDGACLIASPQQIHTELPSSSRMLTSSTHEISALPLQVPPVSDQERPPVSVDSESDQHISSPRHFMVSALHSTDSPSQVDGGTLQHHLPPAHHVASTPSLVRSDQEPPSQRLGSTQSEISMQLPTGTAGDLTTASVSESRSHLPQLFLMATWLPPQGLHPDPLENELTRLRKQEDTYNKMHEEKKLRLKLEYEQEIEKVKRKYEVLFQNTETEFLQVKEKFGAIYSKVVMNQNLAEEFRARFIDHKGGNSATSQGLRSGSAQPFLHVSQPQAVQRPASSLPSSLVTVPVPIATTVPPTTNPASFPSARLRAPVSALPSVSSTHLAPQAPAVFSSNPGRPHFAPLLPPRMNIQAGSEPRAPAPHLQRFRSLMSMSALNLPPQPGLMMSQQQTPAHLSSPSSSFQVSPVPPSYTCSSPASGILQPEESVTLPLPQGTSFTTITTTDLAPSVGDSLNGADRPTVSPLGDMAPAFERWLASNMALTGNVCSNLNNDPVRPSGAGGGAAVDVIRIDDD